MAASNSCSTCTASPRATATTTPPNTLGLHRLSFAVDDLDAEVARLRKEGYEPLRDVVNYQDIFRLCYNRGPEGLIDMLFESLT